MGTMPWEPRQVYGSGVGTILQGTDLWLCHGFLCGWGSRYGAVAGGVLDDDGWFKLSFLETEVLEKVYDWSSSDVFRAHLSIIEAQWFF